ncbi:unnamed protein product [Amoebophrya sp. A120]|nr:unnamed protein product [Amoebophrya sp. A120]|eukprot:GSA120T00001952001.1
MAKREDFVCLTSKSTPKHHVQILSDSYCSASLTQLLVGHIAALFEIS